VNIILLEEHELEQNLQKRDERTIHLLKVLHKKTGDTFEAGVLGKMLGIGKIEKINSDGSIKISFLETQRPLPRMNLRIAVAFVRPIQIRRILRELSNIGISAIDIVGTDMGEKSYRDTNLLINGGSFAALVEGAVQARDTQIPSLSIYDNLDKWLKERPWDADGNAPLLIAMDNVRDEGSLLHLSSSDKFYVLAIGPERGWSDRERDLFLKAGFKRLSMGERALRTETACVAAAALVMRIINN